LLNSTNPDSVICFGVSASGLRWAASGAITNSALLDSDLAGRIGRDCS
jgi:hypothetical protein